MIRINLAGQVNRKKAASGIAMPTGAMPFVLFGLVLLSGAAGFFWYKSLADEGLDLDGKIRSSQTQRAKLEAAIKQDQIYDSLHKQLESRIKIIESLEKNKVNPVLALDVLSDAIEKTQYVWLSQLEQNNAMLTMTGTGTSLNAIADFFSNLQSSGYFKKDKMELTNATDSAGNFTFSLKAEFYPPFINPDTKAPAPAQAAPASPAKGAN